jgi:hypothetical protein
MIRLSSRRRTTLLAGATLVAALAGARDAGARRVRPHFEPTDLELEDTGVTELDLQVGATSGNGDSGNRLLLPDFELDIGLLPNVELDLDGAFSVVHFDRTNRSLAGDPLWTAVKLGLYDSREAQEPNVVAVGLQLGPRIPTIGARGVGYAALALVGFTDHGRQFVLNLGGIIDPGERITRGQSTSLVGGLDVSIDLDSRSTWSLLGEVAGAHYLSADPDEIITTAGVGFSANANLDLSLVVLADLLPGGDRLGVLLGASPKVALW